MVLLAGNTHTPNGAPKQRDVELQLFYWVNISCALHQIASTSSPRSHLPICLIHVWLHFRCRSLPFVDSNFFKELKNTNAKRQKKNLSAKKAFSLFRSAVKPLGSPSQLIIAIKSYNVRLMGTIGTRTSTIIFHASANTLLFCIFVVMIKYKKTAKRIMRKRHFQSEDCDWPSWNRIKSSTNRTNRARNESVHSHSQHLWRFSFYF